jgi:hypothetical protein
LRRRCLRYKYRTCSQRLVNSPAHQCLRTLHCLEFTHHDFRTLTSARISREHAKKSAHSAAQALCSSPAAFLEHLVLIVQLSSTTSLVRLTRTHTPCRTSPLTWMRRSTCSHALHPPCAAMSPTCPVPPHPQFLHLGRPTTSPS